MLNVLINALTKLWSWFSRLDEETKDAIIRAIVRGFEKLLRAFFRDHEQQQEGSAAKNEQEAAAK